VAPAAAATKAGTITSGLLLERWTNAPPAGAGLRNVSRHWLWPPPTSVFGWQERPPPPCELGSMLISKLADAPPRVTVIVGRELGAPEMPIGKLPVVVPPGKCNEFWVEIALELGEIPTVTPPIAAGELKVTVQELPATLGTVDGLHTTARPEESGARTQTVKLWAAPLRIAVRIAG